MAPDYFMKLSIEALWLIVLLSAPPILAAAAAGLLVAIVQSATQLQEQTIQYAVKLCAVVVALLLFLHMMTGTLYAFTARVFLELATVA